MLELRDATKTVAGADHIRDVSLTLQPGSLNVLLGPTLSGKTSLMRLMAGLDRPMSGKRNIAMADQQFINYPAMTVYENIASSLRVAGTANAQVDREGRRAAELLKLTPYLDRTPLSRWPISTTSCARNCGPSCRRSSQRPARSSSTPRPSRTRRSCLAATPPRSRKAGSPSSARRSGFSASPGT